ncbi:AAA family ATPase [Vibrio sp. HN007]|uniref:AAA family ATPase n=1 Tax=Vibrio iocasae TaxID=3098914 RepID=UPI0035D3F2B7
MGKLILVCGPMGAGKTTYAMSICGEINAVKFSIDPWMQRLFAEDMVALDYSWMMERVSRCYDQIWEVSEQIILLGGNVVLDLGFTTKAQRDIFVTKANALNIRAEIHYLDAQVETRRKRIANRNAEKDPNVFSFEVTDIMFNFMEPRFEVPDESELDNGLIVSV